MGQKVSKCCDAFGRFLDGETGIRKKAETRTSIDLMHIGKGPVHVEQIDLSMDEDGRHYLPTKSP